MLDFVEDFVCKEMRNSTVKINALVSRMTLWSSIVFVKLRPVCRRTESLDVEDDIWN